MLASDEIRVTIRVNHSDQETEELCSHCYDTVMAHLRIKAIFESYLLICTLIRKVTEGKLHTLFLNLVTLSKSRSLFNSL